jgi:L-alanine-DL-glutamate epimerase-like enolase superfamily enzyme
MRVEIASIEVSPLNVPLIEPFVIASARVDATRAVLVRASLRPCSEPGSRAARQAWTLGLGECAPLPPVTHEDQADIILALNTAVDTLQGASWSSPEELGALLDSLALTDRPVARSGLECALLDAWARLTRLPLCTFLTGAAPRTLGTDITLPICAPEHMLELAKRHHARGFEVFKVKIGKAIDDDLQALALIATHLPLARFRLDANAAFTAEQALWLLDQARRAQLIIECFEQPCARDDLDGMAKVTALGGLPVVADESVGNLADLERAHRLRAASGVNLKLAKSGGILSALAIGRRARELGMQVMCGGMVETRLGMSAMGHVACALGGADYVDLDTAFLLASDPFEGGYRSQGAELHFDAITAGGLGVSQR